jgi:CRISPR-associated protein Csm2
MADQNYSKSGTRPGGFRGHNPKSEQDFNIESERAQIKKWVQTNVEKETVNFANEFGKNIATKQLTTSQIRNVFGEMRRIQMNGFVNEKTSFILLKPKLAYAVKRHNSKGLTDFYKFFEIAYDAVDTNDDLKGKVHFDNLMNLTEAILAYHKYYGGRE